MVRLENIGAGLDGKPILQLEARDIQVIPGPNGASQSTADGAGRRR